MSGSLFLRNDPDEPAEKVLMHPEDYDALLAWVRAKERWSADRITGTR
jgi:hypothetical protein